MNYDEMLDHLENVRDHYVAGHLYEAVDLAVHTLMTHRPAIKRSMETTQPRTRRYASEEERRRAALQRQRTMRNASKPPEMPSNP